MWFDWDPEKGAGNLRKHEVHFAEASTAFGDPLARIIEDPQHPYGERRFVLLGSSAKNQLLVVIFAEPEPEHIRIISARKARPRERRQYENIKERP